MGQCEATLSHPQGGRESLEEAGEQEALRLDWIAALLVRGCPKPGMGSGPEQ